MLKFNFLLPINSLLFVLLININLSSQCGSYSTIYLTKQDEVNLFPILYPGCTDFNNIVISGYDITNLSPLAQIKTTYDLFIQYCPNLSSLNGLQNISKVRLFSLNHCDNIVTIEPLSNMNVTHHLEFNDNNSLTSLEPLTKVTHLINNLFIGRNPNLYSIKLANLESAALVNINDLPLITNLSGISGLKNITSDFIIWRNVNLRSLMDLNPYLKIDGTATILYNSNLSTCQAKAICNRIQVNRAIIANNANGCDNLETVQIKCGLKYRSTSNQPEQKIYPNPASTYFEINNNSLTKYKLYNSYGIMVWSDQFEGSKQVQVSELPKGIYLLYATNNEGLTSQKITIE